MINIITNMIKMLKIQCSYYMRVRVCRKYSYGQLRKNGICSPAHACTHVGKVYRITMSIIGRSKEDKKLTLLTYMCMRVCIYVRNLKYGFFVFLNPHVRFLLSLETTCHVPVVGKRKSHASSLYVQCVLASLRLVVECPS